MKNALRLTLVFALLLTGAACTDDAPYTGLSVNGGERFLSLDAQARSGKLSIQASATWKITPSAGDDWFTLSELTGPAGYTEVDLSLEVNVGAARSSVLTIVCGDATYPFTLSQAAAGTSFDAPQYYFYTTFGTMPTLYAGLHLLSHDHPSFFFYERPRTFDPAEFPAHATAMTASDRSNPLPNDEALEIADKIKARILEINAERPTAVFGLWTDDLRCRLGYDWFVAQGIDSARVKVTMLSDGTATYNNFHSYFGDPATAEQHWNEYAAQVEALDWNHGGRYPATRAPEAFSSYMWPYYLATRPNYRLMLQNGELLQSSGPFMTAQLHKMQIESVQPYRMLDALSQKARERFYEMAGFDFDHFAALFDASPKKNLIIIGTSHRSAESEEQQADYVARIAAQYGSEYDLFFKPHPADGSSAGYPDRFPSLTLLPGQMPFEIFVWSLLEKVDLLGGYPSTVFLSVPVEKVGFLFAPNAESLIRPLDRLFRDAEVEWME